MVVMRPAHQQAVLTIIIAAIIYEIFSRAADNKLKGDSCAVIKRLGAFFSAYFEYLE
jgi:hypothetical protein